MTEIKYFISSFFLGISAGANDGANIFGTAVSSKIVKYYTALFICAIFIVVGAYFEGAKGIKTLSNLTGQTLQTASVASLSAVITIIFMNYLGFPVSTSQAVIGAILGIGVYNKSFDFTGLTKVFLCWVGTPSVAIIVSILLYHILSFLVNHLKLTIFELDFLLRAGIIISGAYAAYALGANNVANIIGVFSNIVKLKPKLLAVIGGLNMSLGVFLSPKNVMTTIGKKLVPLNAFSSFIAILSEGITVHLYSKIGVPVSATQAIIGAVLGIGVLKGVRTINLKTLLIIISGWIITPLISGIVSFIIISTF